MNNFMNDVVAANVSLYIFSISILSAVSYCHFHITFIYYLYCYYFYQLYVSVLFYYFFFFCVAYRVIAGRHHSELVADTHFLWPFQLPVVLWQSAVASWPLNIFFFAEFIRPRTRTIGWDNGNVVVPSSTKNGQFQQRHKSELWWPIV